MTHEWVGAFVIVAFLVYLDRREAREHTGRRVVLRSPWRAPKASAPVPAAAKLPAHGEDAAQVPGADESGRA